jgi:acetylornithine deacetylase/succinyl-diaminopimelate desuccinylase-like protein
VNDRLHALGAAIERNLDRTIAELVELVGQPSVSSQNIGIRECAELVSRLLERHGFGSRIIETNGYPVVYGEAQGSGPGTLILYNHYDVQPAEPLDLWSSPPFNLTRAGDRLVGRGVADDKGHILCRLAALDAVREVDGALPCQVKFMIEGGEEIGSPDVPDCLEEHRDLFAADACIWELGGVDYNESPQIVLGMRGLCYVELHVRTLGRDAHSGGAHLLPNAAWRLTRALNTLKDLDERILIAGFYDDIRPPAEKDLRALDALPDTEAEELRSYEIERYIAGRTGAGARRAVFQPTANICGISSGYEGAGPKTVTPAQAMAKLDFRLVPDQDPVDIYHKLQRHLQAAGFEDVEVRYLAGVGAAATPVSEPWVQLAIQTAQEVYGRAPQVIPMIGGSGPMHAFRRILGVPIVTAGCGYPESLAHAPNENIRIQDFVLGTHHTALLIARAGELFDPAAVT